MKKWFWFILLFILLVTGAIQLYKSVNILGDTIEVVRDTKDISLNSFLAQYASWTFTKIVLEDETSLKGYQYLGTWNSVSFMTVNKNLTEQYVNVFTTKKPLGTSLSDLWISLTGSVIVDVKFNEKSRRAQLLQDVWPLLLFFVIFILIFRFAMPKGGGGGFPFSVKAGKLNTAKTMKTRFSDVEKPSQIS